MKSVGSRARTAGKVKLQITPTKKTVRLLRRAGKARVRVSVTYTPTDGRPNTQSERLTLRKRDHR